MDWVSPDLAARSSVRRWSAAAPDALDYRHASGAPPSGGGSWGRYRPAFRRFAGAPPVVPLIQGACMTRSAVALVVVALAAALHPSIAAQSPDAPSIAGRWAINRTQSQFPSEVGFAVEW